MTPLAPIPPHPVTPQSPEPAPPGVFAGCPTFLRALCRTASRGGDGGYGEPGFHLGYHARHLAPYDVEDDEWFDLVTAEVQPLVDGGDDAPLLAWVARRFPRVMALVPARRRGAFAAGFRRGYAKGGAE